MWRGQFGAGSRGQTTAVPILLISIFKLSSEKAHSTQKTGERPRIRPKTLLEGCMGRISFRTTVSPVRDALVIGLTSSPINLDMWEMIIISWIK